MSKDQKKPQAFPYSGAGDELNFSAGMLLRDYFAAKAMQAVMSNVKEGDQTFSANRCAVFCYFMADAMMEAKK